MSGLGVLNGPLLGQFAASITPIYVGFFIGLGFCFMDILKLDFTPAISVIIQYVCLPALLFLRIATNKVGDLDLKLLGADALSKFVPLAVLLIWWRFFSKLGRIQSLEWVVTFWMLATLPNTVLIGDQILTPMFKDGVKLSIQSETTTIIFAQSLYWYNTVILLYEIREMFIEDDLAMNPPPPIEFHPGVVPDDRSFAEMTDKQKSGTSWDGRNSPYEPHGGSAWEPNRPGLSWEQQRINAESARPSWEIGRPSWSRAPVDQDLNDYSIGSFTPHSMTPMSMYTPSRIMTPGPFMTPSGMTPNYRFTPSRIIGLDGDYSRSGTTPGRAYLDNVHSSSAMNTPSKTLDHEQSGISIEAPQFDPVKGPVHDRQPWPAQVAHHASPGIESNRIKAAPVFDNMFGRVGNMLFRVTKRMLQVLFRVTKRMLQVLFRVTKRMLQVPLLYGSALGFIWSINKWPVPNFLKGSAKLCADPTVALAMILIGMVAYKFYKGERGFVPCGQKLLWAGFALRFLFAPIVMYVCSLAFNIKGTLLDYAILQVIVPQGSMTFALAQIYGCKLEVITPAIYIQMIVFVPFILAYFAVLGHLN